MHPAALFALAFMLVGAAVCMVRTEWVPPYFAAVLYANVPDTLRAEYHLPSFFMFLAPALLALAIGRQFLVGEDPGRGWKGALWWLIAWGTVILASFLYATDRTRTALTLFDYLDALFIVLIMTLFVRRREQLGPILWALIGAGAFLSVLTVHQGLTGNFGSTYGGFAKGELRNLLEQTSGMRSAGPLSTNYFALILVALVPLAADRMLHARALLARAAAALSLALIVAAIGFTYSRGGFAALGAIALLALIRAPRIPRIAFVAAPLVLIAGIALLPTTYLERMSTFGQIWHGLRGQHVEDSAIRGRISEVRSALMMVGDHPLIGVGSGNYEILYPGYARIVALDPRHEERAAHSLYLEVAAENGVIGLAVFGGLLGFAMVGIEHTRKAFAARGETELRQLATAFAISFAGFLIGSVFLHLSYPRFLWLLVGIALAIRGLSLAPSSPVPIPTSRLLRSGAGGALEVRPCA
jgi:putative inorganic carbon (HCO3(-)) transporter